MEGKHWIKEKNQEFQIHLLSLQHTVWSQARELTSLAWARVSSTIKWGDQTKYLPGLKFYNPSHPLKL